MKSKAPSTSMHNRLRQFPESATTNQSTQLIHYNTDAETNYHLSTREIKAFTLKCIETLANLANFDGGQSISTILNSTIQRHLPRYVSLTKAYKVKPTVANTEQIKHLVSTIPQQLIQTGLEMQFPQPLMQRMSVHLKKAMISTAK